MMVRALGIVLMGVALWDVFVTVLYARARGGVLARTVSYLTWQLFLGAGRLFSRGKTRILPFCGPAVLIALVVVWALMLTVAAALIMQPAMGDGIQATNGPTATDFITTLYAAGGSLAIVGASDFTPHGTVWKLYFLFNSLVGASIISLTLTYLMQVYSALLRRNSLALTLHELTNETDDAAELICGLGPRGDFQTGATTLAQLSSEMAAMKETHHFYPVLFYFRFQETFYSVSQMTLLALDTVSLIRSALDNDEYATLQCSGSLGQLSRSSLKLVTTLHGTFLTSNSPPSTGLTDAASRERWGKRYLDARRRFQQAGISVTSNEQAGLTAYLESRSCWDSMVMALAPAMKFEPGEIDPAGSYAASR